MNNIISISRRLFKKSSSCKQALVSRCISASVVKHSKENNKSRVRDAGQFLSTVLNECKTGCIFAGTGQYYERKDFDRVIMLQFEDDILKNTAITLFDTSQLLDCCLNDADVDLFIDNVKAKSSLPVYSGELDIINQSTWKFGFTLNPFSIFSGDERVLLIQNQLMYVSTEGNTDVIGLNDISYIGLWVSEEPFNERKLVVGLKNDTKRTLIDIEKDSKQCDLAMLTVETEWLMKVAALLCVNISRTGNDDVHLRLSPVLQPINNQWVAMRQKNWIDMIQKNSWNNDT